MISQFVFRYHLRLIKTNFYGGLVLIVDGALKQKQILTILHLFYNLHSSESKMKLGMFPYPLDMKNMNLNIYLALIAIIMLSQGICSLENFKFT